MVKVALVFDPLDHKLQPSSYSQSYRSMFLALLGRLEKNITQEIHSSCSAKDIDADVILFWDIHSSHHINIEGVENHRAVKVEYFNDPHQREVRGRYRDGSHVHKLDAMQRCRRAIGRGVTKIICPYRQGYHQFFGPHLPNDMLIWYPICPDHRMFENGQDLSWRKPNVLANGATQGVCYEFRKKAFQDPAITFIPHYLADPKTPNALCYGDLLKAYAGALAVMDFYPVPKYFEIPLAGCVCFAQYHEDYRDLGFEDGQQCIYVNETDPERFSGQIRDFCEHPTDYQHIATSGQMLARKKYTAERFADYIYQTFEDITDE